MAECIFCAILAGRKPGSFVHREEGVAALLDIRPVNPGHTLVLPTAHAGSLADLPPGTASRMFLVARRVAAALRGGGVRCEGVNLLLADGACAGQEVFHVHLHVLPRFPGDGFGFRFPAGHGSIPAREDLDRIAGTMAGAFAAAGERTP